MSIKNIIFDIGNVLIDWDPRVLYREYFSSEKEIDAFFKEIDFYARNLEADKGRPFKEVFSETAQKFPRYKEAILAYDRGWLKTITGTVDGSLEILIALKKAGYFAYGLSNFSREKFDLISGKYEFVKYFDGLVVSADVGEIKPAETIYNILLRKYNLIASECVFLDDRQENLDTANRLGFKTILFKTAVSAQEQLKTFGVKLGK